MVSSPTGCLINGSVHSGANSSVIVSALEYVAVAKYNAQPKFYNSIQKDELVKVKER